MSPRYNVEGSRRYRAQAPTLEEMQDEIPEVTVFPTTAAELK